MALEPDAALLMVAFVKKYVKIRKKCLKYGSLSQKVALSAKKVADPCFKGLILWEKADHFLVLNYFKRQQSLIWPEAENFFAVL